MIAREKLIKLKMKDKGNQGIIQIFDAGVISDIIKLLDVKSILKFIHAFQSYRSIQSKDFYKINKNECFHQPELWNFLILNFFPSRKSYLNENDAKFLVDQNKNPMPTNDLYFYSGCSSFFLFLNNTFLYQRFNQCIHIYKRSITAIEKFNGRKVDCYAFSSMDSLYTTGTGSNGVIHSKAGIELTRYIRRNFHGNLDTCSAVFTPGFGTGIEYLLHCVTPHAYIVDASDYLDVTYKNSIKMIEKNKDTILTVVFASLGTGGLGHRVKTVAPIALKWFAKAIEDNPTWDIHFIMCCIDNKHFDAFNQAKKQLLENFDS